MATAEKHKKRSQYRHFKGIPYRMFYMNAAERKERKERREQFQAIGEALKGDEADEAS